MERIALSELTTFRWSFEEDVINFHQAGFDGIGIWRQKLSDYGEEKGAELLKEIGLAVSSLQWIGGFTGSDGRNFRESIDDALEAIETAELLGASTLVVYTGPRGGHTENHSKRLFRMAMQEIIPAAQQASVSLAVEPMHRGIGRDWTFLNSVDDTLELLSPFKEESVGIVFDVYQLCHGDYQLEQLNSIVNRIKLVQLADAQGPPQIEQNRFPLGQGVLPFEKVITHLENLGYEGFFEVELLGPEIETIDYQQLLHKTLQTMT